MEGADGDIRTSRELLERSWVPIAIGAFIAAAILVAALILYQAWPRPPGEESADVNFLRDMIVHHDQAVTMGLIIRDRTENQGLLDISTDVVLTQMSQIGMMRGWLERWDYSLISEQPRMSWMGHPVDGLMPGMATPEEIEQLRTLPLAEAEAFFCQLLIRHHSSGIEMAQAALERVDDSESRRLAESIIAGQFNEIRALQEILTQLGVAQEPVTADMGDMPAMDMPADNSATPTGG